MPRPSANWFLFSFAGVLAAGPLEAPAEEASAVRNAVARVGGDALRERAVEIPINDLQSSTASVTAVGPDVTFCQLYGLGQYGRLGSVVGLAIATTSWNVGNLDLRWWAAPDEEHPYIVSNLYRLHNDRLEQIGQSWIKHGFFALADTQCGGTCHYEPGHGVGNWLGQGCTDTYDASLNAMQSGLGPRQEVNPWTGQWTYAGSHISSGHSHNGIQHRLQVRDNDLSSINFPGALFFAEAYYVHLDDVNVMNSASWKAVPVSGPSVGGVWSFGMSGASTPPNIGFAIDTWTGAAQTLLAQEIPVVENASPDGRGILSAKATNLGGGTWHYEYALLNIDMHRKVGAFVVPIDSATTVTNVRFHAPDSHDESYDNVAWSSGSTSDCLGAAAWCLKWTTVNNPVRWGTLYNFRFDANVPPADGPLGPSGQPLGATLTLGLFEPGAPAALSGVTVGPQTAPPGPPPAPLPGDADKNRFLSFALPTLGAGPDTALQVRLASLYHPSVAPTLGTIPDFTPFEEQVRFVNMLGDGVCPDSAVLLTSFRCAQLGCTPEYRDWAGELAGRTLHVVGREIVPSSEYAVTQLAASCAGNESTCLFVSTELTVRTTTWGNVDNDPQLNVLDLAAMVDKVKDLATGTLSKPQTQLQADLPNPQANVSVLDVANAVDALKGFAYPFPGPQNCP